MFIKIDGELFLILGFQHHKPGKGGAFVRTRLRNVRLETVIDRTFRAGETVEEAFIEEKKYQYLYQGDGQYHFMDSDNYEQIALPEKKIGDAKNFMKENMEVTASIYQDEILRIKLPLFVKLRIVETEPGVRGDTAKGATKNAKLETGAAVQVPLFINQGDTVEVDTRTGAYVGRA